MVAKQEQSSGRPEQEVQSTKLFRK